MSELRFRDLSVYVERTGVSGPVVLLLHSSGLSGGQFRRLVARLGTAYRLIVPDLPGYGRSRWPPGRRFDAALELEIVERLVVGEEQPIGVIGHSYGGLLGLRLATLSTVGVRALALFEPIAFGVLRSTADAEGLADLSDLRLGADFFDLTVGGLGGWLERFIDYWNGPGAWVAMGSRQRAPFVAAAAKLYQEVRANVLDATSHESYARVPAQTLLLYGERTTPAARRTSLILAEVMPRAHAHAIRGAGHMGPLTHADEVDSLIVAHLERAFG